MKTFKFKLNVVIVLMALSIIFYGSSYRALSATPEEPMIVSDFEVIEADIRDVFRSLAEVGDYNVLLDPSVQGLVTIKLKNGLPITKAIEYLAQTYGYSYRWITATRTVIIGTEKSFANFEIKETRTYQLNYADPLQVVEALATVIPKENIGVDRRTNQLTMKASVLEHQNIEEIVRRLDREMPQINVEARVEEITSGAAKELGIAYEFRPATSDFPLKFNPVTVATLQALEEQGKAKLLANPNISTTDSQKGRIFIGDKYPIVTSKQSSEGIEYQVEYIEIGTELTIIPRINEDDVVTVVVYANVSSITEWKKLANGDDIPLIRTREASSVIRLRDGETFVLSGLNYSKQNNQKQSVPFLSNIPLLGNLFKATTEDNEGTEVVIFLTPKIVPLSGKSGSQTPKGSQVQSQSAQPQDKVKIEMPSQVVVSAAETKTESVPQVEKPRSTAVVAEEVKVEAAVAKTPVEQTIEGQSLPAVPSVQEPVLQELVPNGSDMEQAVVYQGYTLKYKVKPGETLDSIAAKFGISRESIQQVNGFQEHNGEEIIIPIPENQLYHLKPKETLWRLAKRYGLTVEQLMEINNIADYSKLEIGQVIVLPVSVDKIVDNRF